MAAMLLLIARDERQSESKEEIEDSLNTLLEIAEILK
jgi:hypothetical protein